MFIHSRLQKVDVGRFLNLPCDFLGEIESTGEFLTKFLQEWSRSTWKGELHLLYPHFCKKVTKKVLSAYNYIWNFHQLMLVIDPILGVLGDEDFFISQTYRRTLKVFFHRSFFPIHTYLWNQLVFSGRNSELTETLRDLECMNFILYKNKLYFLYILT